MYACLAHWLMYGLCDLKGSMLTLRKFKKCLCYINFLFFFTFSFWCSSSSHRGGDVVVVKQHPQNAVRKSAVGAPVDGRRQNLADATATVSGGAGGAFAPERCSVPVQWDLFCVCGDGNARRYQRRYWCEWWCYGHSYSYSYSYSSPEFTNPPFSLALRHQQWLAKK